MKLLASILIKTKNMEMKKKNCDTYHTLIRPIPRCNDQYARQNAVWLKQSFHLSNARTHIALWTAGFIDDAPCKFNSFAFIMFKVSAFISGESA